MQIGGFGLAAELAHIGSITNRANPSRLFIQEMSLKNLFPDVYFTVYNNNALVFIKLDKGSFC